MARPAAGARQEEVRRHNLSTVLGHVHLRGSVSRSELSAATGLNRSTIGALTTDLVGAGLVREAPPEGNRGAGRPSLVVVPREDVYVLAVHLGVQALTAARIGLGGRILDRVVVNTPGQAGHEPMQVVARTAEALAGLAGRAGPGTRCVGIGAAVCGLVRTCDGLVRAAPNLGWWDVPYGDLLDEALDPALRGGDRVRVANEADLGVLAEHLRGAAAGANDVIFLFGDIGLGGGVVAGGQPLTGADGYAGEVGHLVLDPAGLRCQCGRPGCWETKVGLGALLRRAGRRPHPDQAAVDDLLAAAAVGEEAAVTALAEHAYWLGLGIGQLVTVFNPSLVIVGGPLATVFRAIAPAVRRQVDEWAMYSARERVMVSEPRLGADSVLIGAAERAFGRLLADPVAVVGGSPWGSA
jgi:predicted NBD/HSP70 family sugar kinase